MNQRTMPAVLWMAALAIRGVQLVHADKHGHWPLDHAYQGVRGGQPVLGPREPLERRKRVR